MVFKVKYSEKKSSNIYHILNFYKRPLTCIVAPFIYLLILVYKYNQLESHMFHIDRCKLIVNQLFVWKSIWKIKLKLLANFGSNVVPNTRKLICINPTHI